MKITGSLDRKYLNTGYHMQGKYPLLIGKGKKSLNWLKVNITKITINSRHKKCDINKMSLRTTL
jgi:hypothetical protein